MHLYLLPSPQRDRVFCDANIALHHGASNILLLGFVELWLRGRSWLAEALIVFNFFNLSFAYFRFPRTSTTFHLGMITGPLVWNFTALYWVGAAALDSTHVVARLAAHLSVLGWLGYGAFYLLVYRDYAMGLALSILCFCESSYITPISIAMVECLTYILKLLGSAFSLRLCLSSDCSNSSHQQWELYYSSRHLQFVHMSISGMLQIRLCRIRSKDTRSSFLMTEVRAVGTV